jgi:long-chain acyl-CoA synthetase
VLADCGAKLLIHEATLADRLPDTSDIPDLKHRISLDDDECASQFPDLAENAAAAAPAAAGEEDTAMILYTSGTTGRPKGAMLAHCNIIHSAMIYETCMELTPADRSIAAVPLAHVTGVVANIMSMLRCAGTLIIVAEFKAADYLKVASRERVTQTVMVPAMYNLCLLQPDFEACDLSAWRIGGYGGAPMPVATIEKLAAKIPGLRLINAYGSTETTSPSTIMPPELTAAHLDSVGLPCPGAHIVVMDADGRELPRGEIGEIWIHSGSVIRGYWNNPQATTESFTGGFWHSGDLGSIDAENFVRVFDRKKDMINRACRSSRRRRERHHRKAVPCAGRARACGDRDPRRQRQPRGAARLVRRAALGLQGAGDHRSHHGATAAQRQRQGDEAAAARGVDGGPVVALQSVSRIGFASDRA